MRCSRVQSLVSLRFSGCSWRRSLDVDGSSGTSRGHARGAALGSRIVGATLLALRPCLCSFLGGEIIGQGVATPVAVAGLAATSAACVTVTGEASRSTRTRPPSGRARRTVTVLSWPAEGHPSGPGRTDITFHRHDHDRLTSLSTSAEGYSKVVRRGTDEGEMQCPPVAV